MLKRSLLLSFALWASLVQLSQATPSSHAVLTIYRIRPADVEPPRRPDRWADISEINWPQLQSDFAKQDDSGRNMQMNLLKFLIFLDVILLLCIVCAMCGD